MTQTHTNGATSTRLDDGRVLVVGGNQGLLINDGPGTRVSAYDPSTNQWSTLNPLKTPRAFHDAIKLPDGRVLVSGGDPSWGTIGTTAAEIFDPKTNTWSNTGSMTVARRSHASALLSDGRVLVAGGAGVNGSSTPVRAEIYDPALGSWAQVYQLVEPWHGYVTLSRLPSGEVLYLSDQGGQIVNATTNTIRSVPPPSTPRRKHKAVVLADGRVLVAGGEATVNGALTALAIVDLFDPATETWASTGSMSRPFEDGDRLLSSTDGVPFVVGLQTRVERYDVISGTWTRLAPFQAYPMTVTAMPDNKLLVIEKGVAELYDTGSPACTPLGCADQGKNCGATTDACGGPITCGGCTSGSQCGSDNVCVACTPTTCQALGKNCGTVSNGCGGTLSCGTCASGSTCSSSNVCSPTNPSVCTHSECTTGSKLTSTCSSCATIVCASDSYCCNSAWDSACVNEAKSWCSGVCSTSSCTPTTCQALGKTCGTISNGCGGTLSCGTCAAGTTCSSSNVCTGQASGCTHSVCSTGTKLTASCSSCATTVCASDSYCCNSAWDSVCVNEAKSWCAAGTCP